MSTEQTRTVRGSAHQATETLKWSLNWTNANEAVQLAGETLLGGGGGGHTFALEFLVTATTTLFSTGMALSRARWRVSVDFYKN